MRQTKSTSADFREILEKSIAVRRVAERQRSFGKTTDAHEVRSFLGTEGYAVTWARLDGIALGSPQRLRLGERRLGAVRVWALKGL